MSYTELLYIRGAMCRLLFQFLTEDGQAKLTHMTDYTMRWFTVRDVDLISLALSPLPTWLHELHFS